MTPERRAKLSGDLFRLASHEQTNEHVARMAFEKYEAVCREDRSRSRLQWSDRLHRAVPIRVQPRGLTFTLPAATPPRARTRAAMYSETPNLVDVLRFAWSLATILASRSGYYFTNCRSASARDLN